MERAWPHHLAPRRAGRAAGILAVSCFVVASAIAPSARAADAPLGLDALERRIDDSPGVRALARQIDADVEAEGVSYARGGLDYVFNDGIGPRSDIVINNLNNNTFRYAQSVGVQLPILGSAIEQKNSLEETRKIEELARIAFADNRRQVLAKLRAAYVSYWEFDREQTIAERYVLRMEHDLHAARALRSSGFWTEANLLDYLETLSRFQTASRANRTQRRAQLSLMSSALGTNLAPFAPRDPTFAAACVPLKSAALASAAAIDPALAKIAADRGLVEAELLRVRGSSIDARLVGDLGTVADLVPGRVGYDVTAGLAVSLPSHARSEERSLRAQLADQLESERLQAEQRNADIDAAVEAAVDDLDDARGDLRQAVIVEEAAREQLREAEVRYRTIPALGATSFNDVQTRVVETYVAETATATARATVFLKLEALLAIAPEACT